MKVHLKIATIMFLIASLLLAGTVYAQEPDTGTDVLPCTSADVSGTVVAIDDQTNTVTINTVDGLCTVVLEEAASGHPIAVLLGQYFGNISLDDFEAALGEAQVCVVHDEEAGTWSKAESCDAEGAVSAQVLSDNGDGSFTLKVGDQVFDLTFDDPDLVKQLGDALKALMVNWDLNEDGSVLQPTDQIAQYHDGGMGFGVLVKLYSMAAVYQGACGDQVVEQAGDDPAETLCGVTVDELVTAFQSGVGMGQLFKTYGKPAHLGVGHIRKAAAQMDAADPGGEEVTAGEGESSAYFFTTKGNKNKPKNSGTPFTTDNGTGPGNGNGNGNGKGNGKGNGNGNGNGNGKGNGACNGNGKGKGGGGCP